MAYIDDNTGLSIEDEIYQINDEEIYQNYDRYDEYETIKVLGSGIFGTVTYSRRKSDGVEFVIKSMDKNSTTELVYKNEISVLQEINPFCEKYLLCLVGARETVNNYYIFLEYLKDYVTLSEFIKNIGPENESIKLIIIYNLIEGLKQLHSLGIAHRDIKADNIMVNNTGHIKFIDFGLACSKNHINHLKLSGTVTFLAPEILLKTIPPKYEDWVKADLWALGMVIYHINNGKSYPDEILDYLKSTPYLKKSSFTHAVAYMLGEIQKGGRISWYEKLKSKNQYIVSCLYRLLQTDPKNRNI